MNTELQESVLDAVSILANKAASGTSTDRTIECEIVAIQDASKGIYTVKYTENKFTAHSANGVIYAVGDSVYVLVPQGDFSKSKVILGSTIPTIVKGKQGGDGSGDEEEKVTQKKEYYDEISENLLTDINDTDLCTYHTESKILTYDSHYLADIIKNYQYFVFKADFRTDIVDIAQRVNGNYGLRIWVPAIKNGEKVFIEKILDIYKMVGNVYNFEKFATQSLYFDFDGATFDPEEQIVISAFVTDFMQSDDETIPPDIFIKNIELKAVNVLTNEDLQGYYLSIDVSEGTYFLDNKYTNDKILTPKLRIDGVFADVRDYECFWFKEDAAVGIDHEYYNPRGGSGWRILNERTQVDTNDDGSAVYDYNTKMYNYTVKKSDIITSARYKCVLLNSNIQTHGIVAITNLNSEMTYSLTTPSGSTTFVKDVGTVNLIAKLHFPTSTDNTTFDYLFRRYDKNGEYLDSDFYDIVEWDAVDGNDRVTKISFPVGNIDEFNIVKCEFVRKLTQNGDVTIDSIGTSSIMLTTGTNVFDYFLSLKNDQHYYKYDANGNSPKIATFDGPYESKIQEVKPIEVKVFKAKGDELSTSEYNAVDMTWSFPKNSMMILAGYTSEQLAALDQDDNYYYIKGKNIMSLSYDIKDVYSNELSDNVVLITVVFDETVLRATAEFTFKKDGESGTNGSKYSIVVKHAVTDEDGIERWYAYGETGKNGLPQKIRPVYVIDTWKRYLNKEYINFGTPKFKVEVYKNGKLLQNSKNEQEEELTDVYSVSWEMFDPNFTNPCFGINTNGELTLNKDWTNAEDVFVNILKASVTITESNDQALNRKEYVYGFYPIDIIRLDSDQKFVPEIAGGYSEVLFDTDGTNPRMNTNKDFQTNVVDGLNNYFICNWSKSDTLILEGKEEEYVSKPFERDYRPISQLVDGQSKNYVKTVLTQTEEKQADINSEAARLRSQVTSLTNQISYLDNEKSYLTTFLGRFSYDSFVNRLTTYCENYLIYRGRYLSILFDLLSTLDEIKEIDPTLVYTEEREALNTIITNIYNAVNISDIVKYETEIDKTGISNPSIIGLINSFNENVVEGGRAYNNLVNYNNVSTELAAFNTVVTDVKALPVQMNDLCSAHDGGEANQEFIKIKNQISIYGDYFRDKTKGYTKKWIADNILKPIEDLLAPYRKSSYIESKYTNPKAELQEQLVQVQAQVAAAGQSLFSHAIVIKPIVFLLNRYGLASVNGWDGNKLYTGSNDEYLFAPQVGAGKKDNGLFTGIVMGVRKNSSGKPDSIGLFGYKAGQQCIFLDATNGNADFGVAGQGQIQMRPDGTSTIAQWRINDNSLSKTVGNSVVGMYADTSYTVSSPLSDGSGSETKSIAFETKNGSNRTYITYDGYLYTNQAYVSGNISARAGYIGGTSGWEITTYGIIGKSTSAFIRAGKTSASDTDAGFYLSQNSISIGNSSNYLKYISGALSIANNSIGLEFNNSHFKVGSSTVYMEYTSSGNFSIVNSNLGLSVTNNEFLVGNIFQGKYMKYTLTDGLLIKGHIEADDGKIGPFYVGKGTDNKEYIWTDYSGTKNFILGEKGICLGGFGKFYLGNNYISENVLINDYQYNGGTIIHTNGGIQTDYLTIMQVGTPAYSPVHPGDGGKIPKGIYMNLSQGQYASYSDTTQLETYPLQLRFVGCDTDNAIIKNSMIGLWSEGRIIIGTKDYGFDKIIPNSDPPATEGHYRAMKASIDGALYVNKNIYCSFGDSLEEDGLSDYSKVYRLCHKEVKMRYEKENGDIDTQTIDLVYVKHTHYSNSSTGLDPVAPSGDGGGIALTPSSDVIVIDSAILNNVGGA